MKPRSFIITICLLVFCSATSEASMLLYHKPEFKGQVVDIGTKAPIEGAVVVAIYKKNTLNPPAGSYTHVIEVKETLTDKNGRFSFPSYTTFIHPLSYSAGCSFLIYKPGYGSQGQVGITSFLSGAAEKNWERVSNNNKNLVFRYLTDGTVEIPRLMTNEDMKDAWMNAHIWGASLDKDEVPILFKTVTNENHKYMIRP